LLNDDGTWKAWTPIVSELYDQLEGAAIEISQSGRGLHIIATGTAPAARRCKDHTNKLFDLYTEKRFVALTGTSIIGNAATVHTAALEAITAKHLTLGASGNAMSWTTEGCEGWYCPDDDSKLVERARRSTSKKGDLGGIRATFEDLWTCNVERLAEAYPPDGNSSAPYGASEADSGLAQHLAFWTGKNCERIKRIMMMSGLAREKWERESYIDTTILKVCARQVDVYGVKSALQGDEFPYRDLSPLRAYKRSERVSIADLYSNPPEPQRFLIADILPGGVLTLLGAHGGTGKSMLALIASVCLVTGRSFMGKRVEQCRVLFYSAEDPAPIVRRRLSRICQFMGIDPTVLAADLIILDATEHPTLYTQVNYATQAYETLREDVAEFAPGAIIIDNASDTYDANEIERARVREFIRLLAGLGKPNNAAVLLLAHIDKQTAKAGGGGEGYSGSTAWHNSARSRLFLSAQNDGLVLEHQKSNLGARSQPIYLKWVDGGLLEHFEALDGADHQATIFRLMKDAYIQGNFISPSLNAANNVYKVLQNEPAYPKFLKRDGLLRIVQLLVMNGRVITEEYKTSHRNMCKRYAVGALSELPHT